MGRGGGTGGADWILGVGADGGMVGVPRVGRGTAVGGVAWAWGEMQAACGVSARELAAVEARGVRARRGALCEVLAGALVGVAGESVMIWTGWIGCGGGTGGAGWAQGGGVEGVMRGVPAAGRVPVECGVLARVEAREVRAGRGALA